MNSVENMSLSVIQDRHKEIRKFIIVIVIVGVKDLCRVVNNFWGVKHNKRTVEYNQRRSCHMSVTLTRVAREGNVLPKNVSILIAIENTR